MLKLIKDSVHAQDDNVDSFDLAIIKELSNNARSMNTEISERICLSPSATLRRHRKLEESNVIEGYHAKINYSLLGYHDVIMLEVKTSILAPQVAFEVRRIAETYGKITNFYRCVDEPGFVVFLAVASASDTAVQLHQHLPNLQFVNGLKLRLISPINSNDPCWESQRESET
ncbi:Lrp/AsnC family transcriptional regulator [Bosea sp. RCC_152_1]|uniref:Lrp/AsnC family transcriptional regulator n=1 Tax=Bosea sp. RCC_152_1 TaxID=3239228 RepID=UPI003524C558